MYQDTIHGTVMWYATYISLILCLVDTVTCLCTGPIIHQKERECNPKLADISSAILASDGTDYTDMCRWNCILFFISNICDLYLLLLYNLSKVNSVLLGSIINKSNKCNCTLYIDTRRFILVQEFIRMKWKI